MTKSKLIDDERESVLVVDDEEDICFLMRDILSRAGISCIAAKSISQAITILDSKKIALVVVDWGLRGRGDTSGSEVLSYCKKKFPLMPVIVMSGQAFDWQTDAILEEADGCLEKPLGSATFLIGTIRGWLKRISLTPEILFPQTEEQIAPLERVKKFYIKHAVSLLSGNVSEAATRLGIHRQTVAAAMEDKN